MKSEKKEKQKKAHFIYLTADSKSTLDRLYKEMEVAESEMLKTGYYLTELSKESLTVLFKMRYIMPAPDRVVKGLVQRKLKKKLKEEFADSVALKWEIKEHDFGDEDG